MTQHAVLNYLSVPRQILKYLVASERLCELGYAEAQVEEAFDMFQNCESQVMTARQWLLAKRLQKGNSNQRCASLLTLNSFSGC